ncbi:S-layer homology domain-containing protein [Nodosilinea sp. PGN35]
MTLAVGLILLAWSSERPVDAEATLIPATQPTPARGVKQLFRRPLPPPPLTVPPPVLPQPLPPQQAWPDLPLVQTQPRFSDLSADHWAWPQLADLARRDLVSGFPDGTFRPGATVTRAELAAQLARLFDLPPDRQNMPLTTYPDLGPDHWAYASVQKSIGMGFLSGHPEGKFLPDQTVTRIQVIVALASGLGLKSSRGAATVLAPYSDRNQVPPWAVGSLVAATDAGLVVNYPHINTLAPSQLASRAEVATMLHRALVYTGRLRQVASPYVVAPSPHPLELNPHP